MKKISIIIVSYNVKELLIDCLQSIYDTVKINVEVIVVDNQSVDGSVESMKDIFPQVLLIENKFNGGFSGANNQGMKLATGDFIFLLNPDTKIIGDTIFQLQTYLEENESCSIVAPQLLNADGTIQNSAWKNHRAFDLVLETFFLNRIFNRLNFPTEKLNTTFKVQAISGAALFFRKELIEKIGDLDENLFWMEDIDFCFRAQKQGELIYLHTAQVVHYSGESQKKSYKISIANQLLSKLKYYRKYYSFFEKSMANISCFIFIFSRCLIFTFISPLKKIYNLKRQAYYYSFSRYLKYIFLNYQSIT